MFQKKTHTKDPENKMREPYFALSNNAKYRGDLQINNSSKQYCCQINYSNKINALYFNHEDLIVKNIVCYLNIIFIIFYVSNQQVSNFYRFAASKDQIFHKDGKVGTDRVKAVYQN